MQANPTGGLLPLWLAPSGIPGRPRAYNLWFWRPALCQLSYRYVMRIACGGRIRTDDLRVLPRHSVQDELHRNILRVPCRSSLCYDSRHAPRALGCLGKGQSRKPPPPSIVRKT